METKAKITGFAVDHLDNKIRLEIEMSNADYAESVETMQKSEIRLSMKLWREKRSLNANGYFFTLVDKLANALRVSKPYVHNLMLRKYGQLQRLDGKPVWVVLPETDEVARKVDEDETLHVRPTDDVREGKDGKMYRTYLLLKGSHEMDSREFSILLDGIIADCKEQNIPTATPEDIRRMKEMWGVDV